MKPARPDLTSLQLGRGLAALAVVFFHAEVVFALPKYFGLPVAPWALPGDCGVAFFFVLSGAIMTIVHWDQAGQGVIPLAFWWKRIRRLVPALWAALTVSLIGVWVTGGLSNLGPWDVLNAYSILPTETEKLLAVEWTLRHEVFFYLLFGVLILSRPIGLAVLAVWFLSGFIGLFVPDSFPLNFWFSPYHVLFGMGLGVGYGLRRPVSSAVARMILAAGLVLLVAFWVTCLLIPAMDIRLKFLLMGLPSSITILGLVTMEKNGVLSVWKPLAFLGDASYSVYLIHFLAISLLAKISVRADAILDLPAWVWYAATVIASTGVGLIFYVLVERPLLRWIPPRPGWTLRPAV